MQRKVCSLADFKFSDAEHGSFAGYGSVFGVVDRQGEIVAKGAFSKSLDRFKNEGWIAVSHDWDALPVASIRDCYEDDRGLYLQADFHSTPEAQAARLYVRERIARKKSVGLSIGYFVRDSMNSPEGVILKEIELAECSLVTLPANPEAGIASVKTVPANPEAGASRVKAGDRRPANGDSRSETLANRHSPIASKAQYLGPYAEQQMTWALLQSVVYALEDALYMCLFYEGEGDRAARLAQADACLAEFHALVMQGLTALYPEDADAEALAAEVKALWNVHPSDPPAGKEFDREIERTQAALADLIPRSREIAALRAKQGRSLSAARREDLTALHRDLGTLLEELKPRATPAERRAAELAWYRRKADLRFCG